MRNKTIVSLSFDDGREDTYRVAYKIMKKYGLIGTIHATTGYIDNTWKPEKWESAKGNMTVEELKEMKENGFEISSHGDKHITKKADLLNSISKFYEWGIDLKKIGFSIPTSKIVEESKVDFIEFLKKNNIAYMRGGRNPQCYTLKLKIIYLLYKISKFQLFYNLFNSRNCIDIYQKNKIDNYNLFSVVVRNEDSATTITKLIESNIDKPKWIILMLHGIQDKNEVTYGKDPWCWDKLNFETLCKSLKHMEDSGDISVKTILDVIEEIK